MGLDQAQQLGQSLAEQVENTLQITGEPGGKYPGSPGLPGAGVRYLRPPGALDEDVCANTCSRCGDCVAACPAKCIILDPQKASGLPHIVARTSPCVICDDLACMTVCPTGALAPLPVATLIDMGTAQMDFDQCIRTHDGDECRVCVEQCPIGETALGIAPGDAANPIEVREGCTGCGVCEHQCPTDPAAIVVVPRPKKA